MRRIRSASPKFSPAIKGIPLNTSPQEALVRTDGHPKLHIEYEILLSPTYQVPVLYFVLHWDIQGPIGLDAVYRYLVPESYRKQLKNVGVMGGISFGVGGISSPPFPRNRKRNEKVDLMMFNGSCLVVSSGIWRSGLLCSPVQHGGCHGKDCRCTDGNPRDVSSHLARTGGPVCEPTRPTRAYLVPGWC